MNRKQPSHIIQQEETQEEFQERNVSDKSHLQYNEFLDILRQPKILEDDTIIKNYWINDLND